MLKGTLKWNFDDDENSDENNMNNYLCENL